MAYSKTTWANGVAPYLNATNLNKVETGIYDAHVAAAAAQGAAAAAQADADTAQGAAAAAQADADTAQSGVTAINAELGSDPAGAYATLAARISAAEARLLALEGTGGGGTTFPYGPAISMDGIGNLQVGGYLSGASNTYVSYRFRAQQSSTLSSVRNYYIGTWAGAGYAGGTGGTIRVSIEADAAGVPSGTALAYEYLEGPGNAGGAAAFVTATFGTPASVTSGSLYHVVFTNVDASPTVNYVSVDTVFNDTPTSPRQPSWPDGDYAVLRKYGTGPWGVESNYTPIMDVTYGNTEHQGIGYMEVEMTNSPVISGTNYMARERFTVSGGSRSVTGAAVRVARTSGSGVLTVSLESSAGAVIDSFTVSTASVPIQSFSGDPAGIWLSGSFASSRTLADGTEYRLRISTDASTSLWTRGIQKASGNGFSAATYFADGYLEKTVNGSTWATVSGLATAGDLQFYFT